ncbi:MAG: NAD(P)H-quinone oxidoreductase [Polyangiaceae bacterium]
MRAIVIREPGGPEVLELRQVPTPIPQRGEARVRVRATAVNRADLLQRMGAYPAPLDSPRDIPGLELAGEVDAVGEGVASVRVGDRVFGLAGGGTYAEQVVVPARTLVRLPEGLSFAEGAAIPEAFVTAYDAMVTQAGLAAGETVLVHAVGSGVGTAAVQIARAIGAFSIGTARSAAKLDRARPMGLGEGIVVEGGKLADRVNAITGSRGVDVVVELVGGGYVAEDLACVAPRGRIVVVGLLAGARAELDLGLLLRKRVEIRGTVLRSRPLEEKIDAANLLARHLAPLFATRQLEPVIDKVLPFARAAEAHAYMASNEGFGKVVLEVD